MKSQSNHSLNNHSNEEPVTNNPLTKVNQLTELELFQNFNNIILQFFDILSSFDVSHFSPRFCYNENEAVLEIKVSFLLVKDHLDHYLQPHLMRWPKKEIIHMDILWWMEEAQPQTSILKHIIQGKIWIIFLNSLSNFCSMTLRCLFVI